MTQISKNSPKPLGTIRLDCEPSSVLSVGLKQILQEQAWVQVGKSGPSDSPSSIILCADAAEGVSELVSRAKEAHPDTLILVFGPGMDLTLAEGALQAGAHGFIHGGMRPKQIIRAIEIAEKGELVAPRQLLPHLIGRLMDSQDEVNLGDLSPRQLQILEMVVEGLSNAEIGKRLYLSESTIKQHLRAAYKVLGVSSRTQASKLLIRRLRY